MMLLLLLAAPVVIVAEGERFVPQDKKGWKATPQDDTYGSHTYGGMWMSQGGCLGAAADSDGSVATSEVAIPEAGKYRVWSKYQAPPYFNYLHRIEVVQGGKVVASKDYGKAGSPRLWSFSGESDECWWPWGVDHDCAEGGPAAELAKGPATLRLTALKNPAPAGARFIDFVVVTKELRDTYRGFKPNQIGSPFINEALDATRFYARFRNTSKAAAAMKAERGGHLQPQYGGATKSFPEKPVAPGEWSGWFDIGSFCRLAHDEGLTLSVAGTASFPVQFARDADGKRPAGEVEVTPESGQVFIPIDVTWNEKATVRTSKAHAEALMEQMKGWRRASKSKPARLAFYGAFSGSEPWVAKLKDALGYNTHLPAPYATIKPGDLTAHHGTDAAVTALAKKLTDAERKNLRVVSFGDEIGLGRVNFADPAVIKRFRAWLAARKVSAVELGADPATAKPADAPKRLAWHSSLFNEEEVFAGFRKTTELTKRLIGPHAETGANYSPHHLALCYGPVHQWIDLFKHRGMSMFWAEDYIFSVPETPQMLSWMYAQAHAAAKYHGSPIHFYIMPHAPGQVAANLRRNMLFAIGSGTAHIDNFWVAPPMRFTENYVSFRYPDSYRALYESIHDAAAVEHLSVGGKRRPAKVAVIVGKATDYNESRLKRKKEEDPFSRRCANAPATIDQTLCRKEQQYQYLALRHAGHAVDLITEDDIAEGRLKQYQVVHFAGEWIERRTVKTLEAWVKSGGALFASAGLGWRNEYDEADDSLPNLLGVKVGAMKKTLIAPRTLLELPLAEPVGKVKMPEGDVPAYGMRQDIEATEAKAVAKWEDGKPAFTERVLGKGKAFAVGTLPAMAYTRSGLKPIPYARGGRGSLYHPGPFRDAGLTRLAVAGIKRDAWNDRPAVEALLLDNKDGTLLTLVNWSDKPAKGGEWHVVFPAKPGKATLVSSGKPVAFDWKDGVATFKLDVAVGEMVVFGK
ncbi:MAG: beta-galactosidase trimerization domain-containing protein [Gemmataceae bacterium]|nr:beta-galactosidase trimerization domain-containing protein [Gemmataceae bacterium]